MTVHRSADLPGHRSERFEVEKDCRKTVASWNPASRRFQTDQTGVGSRAANRTSAIGADGDRADPGRNRGHGAAAGSAGRQFQVPGIPGGPEDQIIGITLESEFRAIGFAKNDRAGFTKPGNRQFIRFRNIVGVEFAPPGGS